MEFHGQHLDLQRSESFLVSRAKHSHGLASPNHSHEYGCIHFVSSGVYQETIEGKRFSLEPGEVVYKPAGVTHSNEFRTTGATSCRVEFHISSDFDIALPSKPMRFVHPSVSDCFLKLQRELVSGDDLSPLAVDCISWEILFQVIRLDRKTCERRDGPKLDSVVARLNVEYLSPPSVTELAENLGIHRSRLTRLFKKATGMTISEYVRHRRIEKATHLLEGTDSPIACIALDCGFADESHFSKSFRRVTQFTPGAWRRRNR